MGVAIVIPHCFIVSGLRYTESLLLGGTLPPIESNNNNNWLLLYYHNNLFVVILTHLLILHINNHLIYSQIVCHVIHSSMMVHNNCLQLLTIFLLSGSLQDYSWTSSQKTLAHVFRNSHRPPCTNTWWPRPFVVDVMDFPSFFSSMFGRDCSEIETDPRADPFDKSVAIIICYINTCYPHFSSICMCHWIHSNCYCCLF